MSQIIREVRITNHLLDPAQAELRIEVELDAAAPAVEIAGRLMGPRCLYSTTVEVAYPLRPAGDPMRHFRVIIPEPSLWDPISPFLYEGPLEVWEGGRRVERLQLCHGLRTLTLGPQGLRLNGRPLMLHGIQTADASEAQLTAWRQRGVNLLVVPIEQAARIADLADRLGFLVVARCVDSAPRDASRLDEHPSWLGYTGAAGALRGTQVRICSLEEASSLPSASLPFLVIASAPPAQPQGLGWIEP